jgi:hypothetical protein
MLNLPEVEPTGTSNTKKPTSKNKILANKLNGQKSHGPINTSITKHNATKHGLLTAGVSELDDAQGYRRQLQQLMEEKNPVGQIETFLVETAALNMVRVARARRLQAEYIRSAMHPPIYEGAMPTEQDLYKGTLVDPGFPPLLGPKEVQGLVNTYQRYESTLFSQWQKSLHDLERLQRMRLGEAVPAPGAVDVSLHVDAE